MKNSDHQLIYVDHRNLVAYKYPEDDINIEWARSFLWTAFHQKFSKHGYSIKLTKSAVPYVEEALRIAEQEGFFIDQKIYEVLKPYKEEYEKEREEERLFAERINNLYDEWRAFKNKKKCWERIGKSGTCALCWNLSRRRENDDTICTCKKTGDPLELARNPYSIFYDVAKPNENCPLRTTEEEEKEASMDYSEFIFNRLGKEEYEKHYGVFDKENIIAEYEALTATYIPYDMEWN